MTPHQKSRTALAAAALLAAGLPMLSAPVAQALEPAGSIELALVDVDQARPEIFAPATGQRAPLPGYGSAPPGRPLVSASGDRTVRIEGSPGERIVVRDISGTVVTTQTTTSAAQPVLLDVALSPSGNRLVWAQGVYDDGFLASFHIWTRPVAGGPAREVASLDDNNISLREMVSEDLVLLSSLSVDRLDVLSLRDGSRRPVEGLDRPSRPDDGIAALDRTRTKALLVNSLEGGTWVAPVTVIGTQVTVGSPQAVLSDVRASTFSTDASSVWFVDGGEVYQQPLNGGARSLLGPATPNYYETSVQRAASDSVAPASPSSSGPAVRTGATATVPYTIPADPSASLVVAVRTSPGLPAKTVRAVVPNPIVDTGVVPGRTYTYVLRQVDRSGNTGPAATTVLRQSAPAAAVRVSGQQLTAGQFLRSANGVRLRVNPDGNLVALSPRGNVLFQTRTRGTQPVLRVNPDGNVVLLSGSRVLWQTRTNGQGTVALVAQDDGNVVLYRDRDGRAVWSTRSGRTY